jgi:hypothetical protein
MFRLTSVLITVFIAACSDTNQTSELPVDGVGYVVRCTSEPLSEVTLGPASRPSRQQETELCACIWGSLGSWERRTAEQLAQGRESEVSALNLAAFPARFGSAVERCGGMEP